MLVYVMSFVVQLVHIFWVGQLSKRPNLLCILTHGQIWPKLSCIVLVTHFAAEFCWYCFGKLSNPHQLSPFSILSSSSIISPSSCPEALTTFQNWMNSSRLTSPSLFTSTVLKNSFADILPKAPFQWFTASFLSMALLPSVSKSLKTSLTLFSTSGERFPYFNTRRRQCLWYS